MKFSTIRRLAAGTVEMLLRKMQGQTVRAELERRSVEAVGLCQGTVLEILVASDIAEKTAGVIAGEVGGNCPQHITCLAVLGDTGSVKAAMEAIQETMQTI